MCFLRECSVIITLMSSHSVVRFQSALYTCAVHTSHLTAEPEETKRS